ncbi:putative uncharacterized protein [Acetobacter sp. CAG:977]|nr:putative uncharacterized protein [Acetobacter sp. CAG:977]
MINRYRQFFLRQPEFFRHQIPSIIDGFFFEIIAERPVPQHFKKSMMAHRIADIVQIVVFSARAHAFLIRRRSNVRAFFHARKDVLKLHHPRIREHQGRIVVRYQRTGRNDYVIVLFKIIQKRRTDFLCRHHRCSSQK